MESSTDENEDWLRSMKWDLPTTLPELLDAMGVGRNAPADQQREELARLTGLPAWKPCPEPLKSEIKSFISGYA